MPGGRPTSYDPKYCEEIIEYFSRPPYREVERESVDKKTGKVTKSIVREATDFPSFAGFAAQIGVNRDTLREWCDAQREFSAAYKRCKELQENFVIVNGNAGLINTAFGIFTAKNVLMWRDRQPDEAPTIVNNFSNLSDEDLDRKLEEKLKKK